MVRAQGGTFISLACEVGGQWGDKAVAFFKLIAQQATSTISEAAAFEAYYRGGRPPKYSRHTGIPIQPTPGAHKSSIKSP